MFTDKLTIICVIICSTLFGTVQNRSLYGIGTRIIGDQLVLKDIQQSRPAGVAQRPTVNFNYAVPEPITCIEIMSEENVLAEVNFSYQDSLVKGTVRAVNVTAPDFEVVIKMYGFAETMLNVNPALIINRDQQFEGILEPLDYDDSTADDDDDDDGEEENAFADDEDYLNLSEESPYHIPTNAEDMNGDNDEDNGADFDSLDAPLDKIIELGHRQKDDYLIYETFQTSPPMEGESGNHSVTFYYIDSNYITYVRFTVFEYFADKSIPQANSAMAVYSHYTPTTLKAVISDSETRFLFVQMSMYGYKPQDLPRSYVPYLGNLPPARNIFTPIATESPMSPLQRLRALMNANPTEMSELKEGDNMHLMIADSESRSLKGSDGSGSTTEESSATQPFVHFMLVILLAINVTLRPTLRLLT